MKINELFNDVVSEDLKYEFKAVLNQDNPLKWAKTLVAFANSSGGVLFAGVSDDGEAFGLTLAEIDKTKNLVARINDRHIFPHIRIRYMLRSTDEEAERFVLAIIVKASDSVVRYREGDYSEIVYVKGNGNATPATPEEIISLSKRKYGVDDEVSEIAYDEKEWTGFLSLCREYRENSTLPALKELQNEEIVSKEGYAKTGFLMFKDDYDGDDSLICCRLWKGLNKAGSVLDSARYKGHLSQVFSYALRFIERNTRSGWEKTESGGRREVRSYPTGAIREALVNAIAHRDYSIIGTQIDIDIFDDRIDIVSPGDWLLPKPYDEYPVGSIPSIRRNKIIAACLDIANLMERGGTGFQTIVDSYRSYPQEKQPGVLIFPGFLDLRLFDTLYESNMEIEVKEIPDSDKVIELLKFGGKTVKELQTALKYKNRGDFLKTVINPLINEGRIYRDGNIKSPTALIQLCSNKHESDS
ncbi:MAG: RNA-binding domain-containing protein [Bullifex sp.]